VRSTRTDQARPAALAAQHETAADLLDGERAFRNNCANCHGPDGDQIAGIDLEFLGTVVQGAGAAKILFTSVRDGNTIAIPAALRSPDYRPQGFRVEAPAAFTTEPQRRTEAL